MTRKDYVKLAGALAGERPQPNWLNKLVQWQQDTRTIAHVLALDNPNFDYARFYDACER